jgi:hypothetical protein
MKIDKLVKIIDVLVEERIQKQLPRLVKEEVNRLLLEVDTKSNISEIKSSPKQKNTKRKVKEYTSNPILNDILNDTEPFSNVERRVENEGLFSEGVNKTIKMDSSMGQLDRESLRSVFAAKMGYGDVTPNSSNVSSSKKTGLGVSTGIESLDRVLNRDNTELVRKMMEKSNKTG